ncbi:MAG: thymidine phosphorylase [Calditrichaeota bacterium]|nr:MAG: thymidine phosphorylase [Calditrichota bacterium]
MTPYEVIARKRDGHKLTAEEIEFFISNYMKNRITDYQMAAMLMAIYLRGMDFEETSALTQAYINSGDTVNLSDIPGIKVDKHSTGGVGDKVSLILAPLAASLGIVVPMMSGRGLGHSGGTLDKLESIPGFRTDLSLKEFKEVLKKIGVCMIGQTRKLVPADKRIYALRDVTATVDSIPLISASIMSKKIAEGIDGLVLDVKYGNGAFMKDPRDAENLAINLLKIGSQFNKEVVAVLTSMEQPLGLAVGNWLEVRESLECLKGDGPEDVMEVTYLLCAHMLKIARKVTTTEEGIEKCQEAIKTGAAYEKFKEIVREQDGDLSYIEHPEKYPECEYIFPLISNQEGFISSIDTFQIGMASVELGAGRLSAEDDIDPAVGIYFHKKVGAKVFPGDVILEIHANDQEKLRKVEKRIEAAITISTVKPEVPKLILKEIIQDA